MNPETEKFVATKELEQACVEYVESHGKMVAVITRAVDESLKSGAKLIECVNRVTKLLK